MSVNGLGARERTATRWPETWIVPDWSVPHSVRSVMTSREGLEASDCGVIGSSPYRDMNLGIHTGDEIERVLANRRALSQATGVDVRWVEQVHGVLAMRADTATGLVQADAQFTSVSGVGCAINVADCLPVLFCFQRPGCAQPSVAAAHAGWRGLCGYGYSNGVLESTMRAVMLDCSATEAGDSVLPTGGGSAAEWVVWLGPCIGQQAFEVGDEVRSAFLSRNDADEPFFHLNAKGRYQCDLAGLARARLQRMGVSQIFGNDGSPVWCTATHSDVYYSHRASGGRAGRMAACVWIVDELG